MKTLAIEEFRKKKAEGREHSAPPPPGHTLAEILKNEKRSRIFGKLLEKEGLEDLALRVAQGKLEAADVIFLEEQRSKFSEIITRTEQLGKFLTTENIVDLVHNNPEFEKIVNLLGSEKAIKVIQGQLEEVAVTDEERFEEIANAIEEQESYKNGEYKETNDEVKKMCEDGQFTPKEYFAALAIEDPKEKEKALRELARRSMSGFKKLVGAVVPKKSRLGRWVESGLTDLKETEISLEDSVAGLEERQRTISDLLFYSVCNNDDMRDAFSRELIGEKAETEEKSGFSGTKQEAESFDDEVFNKEWAAYKKKMNYDGSTEDEREYLKDTFIDGQKEKYRKRNLKSKGLWYSVFATLFEKKISNKKDKLK